VRDGKNNERDSASFSPAVRRSDLAEDRPPVTLFVRHTDHKLPDALGGGLGVAARTEGELEDALALADRKRDELVLIEVQVDRRDATDALTRVAENLRKLAQKG
jgi:hypothetical protein